MEDIFLTLFAVSHHVWFGFYDLSCDRMHLAHLATYAQIQRKWGIKIDLESN